MSIDSSPLNTDQIINNICSFTMYFCDVQNKFHIFSRTILIIYILFNGLRTEIYSFTFTISTESSCRGRPSYKHVIRQSEFECTIYEMYSWFFRKYSNPPHLSPRYHICARRQRVDLLCL